MPNSSDISRAALSGHGSSRHTRQRKGMRVEGSDEDSRKPLQNLFCTCRNGSM